MGKIDIPDSSALKSFDVIAFAKTVLDEVDRIRSYTVDTDPETRQSNKIPNETRLNAFFRLIGLPSFVTIEARDKKSKNSGEDLSGERHLNPGYFGKKFDKYIIKDTDSVIINGRSLYMLKRREENLKNIENSIGTKEMNDKMLEALQYPMTVGANVEGTIIKETKESTRTGRTFDKSLFPLVTSSIDVLPVRNEMARPFVMDIQNQKIDETTTLLRPFIETVTRIRLVTVKNSENQKGKEKDEQIESSVTENGGNIETIDEFFDLIKSADLLEQYILHNLGKSVEEIAKRVVRLGNERDRSFNKLPYLISIKTASAKNVFGRKTDPSLDLMLDEVGKGRQIAQEYRSLKTQLSLEEAIHSLLPTNDVIFNPANASNIENRSVAPAALNSPLMKLLNRDTEDLKKKISKIEGHMKRETQRLEKFRVELEMTTGEFTGLSIIDVIAVIMGLFLIEDRHLIALLDREVKDSMKIDPSLESAIVKAGNPEGIEDAIVAVEDLENKVELVFRLFDLAVSEELNRSKKRGRGGNKGKRESANKLEAFDVNNIYGNEPPE